jgi:hypothetical protein
MKSPKSESPESPQRLRFAAEIPGGKNGPLWKLNVEALSEPAPGGGERLRLRAQVQTNLASVARPALASLGERGLARLPAAAQQAGTAMAPYAQQVSRWLADWAQARAQKAAPRLARWAAPLLRNDFTTWFELHASTAPLVEGAKALLPHADKLSQLGITPNLGPNAPAVQAWQGRIGDEAAQVSLLRLDDRQLPENLRAQLGGKPFSLAAAVVNVVARKA